jgi:phosphatidylglycerol:prolipoprotein diacylglycerol transferase
MYPELFKIGPVSVYSYGLMLGIGFLVGSYVLAADLKRRKVNENEGIILTLIAIIFGLIGGKVFYIIEEWNFGNGLPISTLLKNDFFSAAGLTFYGGLIFSILAIWIYCRIRKYPLLMIFDAMSPAAAIGYGIARIGCHLSGDGCYGVRVDGTFWEFLGVSYSKGLVPTSPGVLVLPTPLFEFVASAIVFIILWKIRSKMKYNGQLFWIYLILTGIPRLLVEIIRNNPRIIWGLSQAQIISIAMIVLGTIMLYINRKRQTAKV